MLEAVAAGAYADAALERARARSTLSPADRALATELVLGAIRQRRLLDAWLDAHGKVRASRQPPRLRWLLHLGLYQLLFSERIPVSAAVGTSVELAKRGGLGRLASVVNGVLRSAARQRERSRAAASGALEPWDGLPLPSRPRPVLRDPPFPAPMAGRRPAPLAAAGGGGGLCPGQQHRRPDGSAGPSAAYQPGSHAGRLRRGRD